MGSITGFGRTEDSKNGSHYLPAWHSVLVFGGLPPGDLVQLFQPRRCPLIFRTLRASLKLACFCFAIVHMEAHGNSRVTKASATKVLIVPLITFVVFSPNLKPINCKLF